MNKADFVILIGFIFALIPLIWAAFEKELGVTRYGRGEGNIWTMLILAAFLVNDKDLVHAVIFGLIAGTIAQPSLADPYLTAKTLVYGDRKRLVFKTPIWVACLWGIALTQLYYLWTRIDVLTNYLDIAKEPISQYFLFVVIGFLYFYVFELIVNNFTNWWWRKNCRQPLGVAIYVSLAELFTAALIPFLVELSKITPIDDVSMFFTIVGVSLIGGFVIALIFTSLCNIFTHTPTPKINNTAD